MDIKDYKFEKTTIKDYRNKKDSYHKDDVTIYEFLVDPKTFSQAPNSTCPVEQKGATLGISELGQFLYMDVGRWGGDGPGLQDTDKTWSRQRNFGLVCGSGAILCNYNKRNKPNNVDLSNIDKKVKEHPDIKKMIQILDKLSESEKLGSVSIIKALVCPYKLYDEPCSTEILVFLGDLHAPIMVSSRRTYLQSLPLDKTINKKWARPRGRISIETANVLKVIAMITAIHPGIPLPTKILMLKTCLDYFISTQQVKSWDDKERIKGSEAKEWFDLYHGTGTTKGADIFQNAGIDLMEFLKLLLEYQKEGSIQARLIQLGDLYDFWIGLKRAFDNINPEKMINHSAAQDFINFWRKETLQAGPAIDMLLNGTKKLNPVFIYGNHDSYRATSLWSKYEHSPDHFAPTGIWAEHGHQEDEYNRDSSPDMGWALTQLAFFAPNVRQIEAPLKNAKTWAFGELGDRLTYIRRAAWKCRQIEKKKIFVMGHTHEPILKIVHVKEFCTPSLHVPPPNLPWRPQE